MQKLEKLQAIARKSACDDAVLARIFTQCVILIVVMVVTIHIMLALASLGLTSWSLVRPSRGKLRVSYGLIGGTLLSGVVLVVLGGSLVSFCVSGTLFTLVTVALCRLAERRLRSPGAAA